MLHSARSVARSSLWDCEYACRIACVAAPRDSPLRSSLPIDTAHHAVARRVAAAPPAAARACVRARARVRPRASTRTAVHTHRARQFSSTRGMIPCMSILVARGRAKVAAVLLRLRRTGLNAFETCSNQYADYDDHTGFLGAPVILRI
jgi:hypothetical protein